MKIIGNKLNVLKVEICGDGSMKTFDEVFEDKTKYGTKIKTSEYRDSGLHLIIDQGQKSVAGYTNLKEGLFEDVPAIIFGDHTRVVKYVDKPFFLGADGVKILKSKIENANLKYLYYALINAKVPNTGYNRHFKWLREVKINYPELTEQQKIVDILDKTERIILEEKQQLEELNNLVKSRFVEMFGDPMSNPMRWSVHLIEEVVSDEKNALKAGPFGSDLKKEFYVESGYKIYGQEQVINEDSTYGDYYIDEERYKSLENCAVKAGDVLISLVGTYGRLLIIPETFEPGIINPRLMKITFDKTKINPIYFKYYFQSDSLKQALSENTHGGTMDILNLGIVRKLKVPLPPIELQNQFAAFVRQTDKSRVA